MATSFARNSLHSAIAGISTTFAGFLGSVLVARLLGVEGTGVVAFAAWVLAVAVMVCDLGVPGALARYLPDLRARGEEDQAEALVAYLLRPLVLAVLAVSALVLAHAAVLVDHGAVIDPIVRPGSYRENPWFWGLIAAAILAQGLAAFTNGYLRGRQDFARLARLAVASAALQVLTTLVGGALFGVTGALLAGAVGFVIPAAMLLAIAPRPAALAPDLKRRVTVFALESWAGYVVTAFVWSRMEVFFLERSWGSEAVGVFSVSLTLANLATQGPLLLTGALLPYLAEQAGAGASDKASEAYRTGLRLLALLVLPACLGAAAVAPALLTALYGDRFAPAVPTATLLLCTSAIPAVAQVASTYLLALERTRVSFGIGLLGAALTMVAGFTLVPALGPIGAAAARGAIQILLAALALWYLAARVGCPPPLGALARVAAAALLCAGAARLVLLAAGTSAAALLAAIVAGGLVYLVALRVFGALPRGDAERLTAMTANLPGPLRRAVAVLVGLAVR